MTPDASEYLSMTVPKGAASTIFSLVHLRRIRCRRTNSAVAVHVEPARHRQPESLPDVDDLAGRATFFVGLACQDDGRPRARARGARHVRNHPRADHLEQSVLPAPGREPRRASTGRFPRRATFAALADVRESGRCQRNPIDSRRAGRHDPGGAGSFTQSSHAPRSIASCCFNS